MTLAERVLEVVDGRANAEARAVTTTTSLTRFANSFIHQNVSDTETTVLLTIERDGRVAAVSTQVTTDEGLAKLVDSGLEVAATSPVSERFPGFSEPADVPELDNYDDQTAQATPAQRAEAVKAFVDAGDGLLAAGYCDTLVIDSSYANSSGQTATGGGTRAVIDGIHQTGSSAGSAHQASTRLADLDAGAAGAQAASKARAGEDAFDLKPGRYEVVLEPAAVGTMAIFLAFYGFNGLALAEGRSFAAAGDETFDPSFTLWDDGTDPRAIALPFDAEGTPKRHVPLVDEGVIAGHTHDRATGALVGAASTGHALPPDSRTYGAIAGNLFVATGDSTREEMIAAVDRGLLVTEFNYCRVLDPRTVGMTGLTRNGTFMIENGQITGAVTNLRFTQSVVEALAPDAVLGIESTARLSQSEFGPGITHVPSMQLAEWNFTGGAAG